MSTTPALSTSFEDKMKDRIKNSIGDLISDEELSKLIAKGINDLYFKPTQIKKGYHTEDGPSLMDTIIKESLHDTVKELVDAWIVDNDERIMQMVTNVVSNGIGPAVLSALGNTFNFQLDTLSLNIQNQLINMRQ